MALDVWFHGYPLCLDMEDALEEFDARYIHGEFLSIFDLFDIGFNIDVKGYLWHLQYWHVLKYSSYGRHG